jgi:hypothetical protein
MSETYKGNHMNISNLDRQNQLFQRSTSKGSVLQIKMLGPC